MIRSVDVILNHLTGIIVAVSVKLPKSVSDILFPGFHIIGQAPVLFTVECILGIKVNDVELV